MRRVWQILVLGLALAGCNINLDPNVATPNQVAIAVNAFNAAEVTGTNFLRFCKANPEQSVCTRARIHGIVVALRAGHIAENQLLADLESNSALPITLFQTLAATIATVRALNK